MTIEQIEELERQLKTVALDKTIEVVKARAYSRDGMYTAEQVIDYSNKIYEWLLKKSK